MGRVLALVLRVTRWVSGSDADWGARENTVAALSLAFLLAWVVMVGVYGTAGEFAMMRFALVTAGASVAPLVVLRLKSATAAGYLLLAVMFGVMLAHGHGMAHTQAALTMVAVPIGAALALGGRAAVVWTILAAAGSASISWAQDMTPLLGSVLFVAGTGLGSALVELGRERTTRRLRSARAEAIASTLELRGQQDRFARVVEQAFDGVIEVELPGGTIVAASEGVEALLGREQGELLGLGYAEVFGAIVGDDEAGDGGDVLSSLLRGPKVHAVDVRCRHAGGHDVVVACSGGEFLDRMSRRAIFALRDVTAERAASAGIEERERLETVSRLAGGIAHDFNNLLTVILGSAEAIPDSANQQGIIRAARKAKALTTQLMAFSRRTPQRAVPIDVASTVVEAVDLIEHAMPENIQVVAELETGLTVSLDPNRLHQVLLNLAFNARDAMPDGGEIRVVVGADLEQSVPRARIEVIDNGAGMDAETKRRAFEPFFTTKGVGKGTGLGLASVYGIVRAYGGLVDIKSEPGRGTRVCVRFPIEEGQAHPSVEDSALGLAVDRVGLLRDARILLIEDEDGVRTLLARALERHGAVVEQHADGIDGAAAAPAFGPDLVITDMIMPRGSGPQVVADVRARWPTLPVLIISGHEPEREPAVVLDERTRFLAKPFMGATLVRNAVLLLSERDEVRGRTAQVGGAVRA